MHLILFDTKKNIHKKESTTIPLSKLGTQFDLKGRYEAVKKQVVRHDSHAVFVQTIVCSNSRRQLRLP